jgi:hypothetical protein
MMILTLEAVGQARLFVLKHRSGSHAPALSPIGSRGQTM